jgi:hypothetical protein
MLSETRAYGQAFLVAEQIPTKLAPDVLKNTNLKVVHRTVAGDDRQVLAQAMNMREAQSDMFAVLQPGEAVVFTEGEDRPLLIHVPYAKVRTSPEMATRNASDQRVAEHMQTFREQSEFTSLFLPFLTCRDHCVQPYAYCEIARELIAPRQFQELFCALVLAVLEDATTIPARLAAMESYVNAQAPQHILEGDAIPCIINNAIRHYRE